MAVVKSFELKGNKQSFASWISNLSPCDTPFSSMIGKEGITQTQYSWQTDSLSPADNLAPLEGGLIAFKAPASTTEVTNFTSILRKAVHVSDTAEAISTYGRSSELAYQMTKAGKELMRELEWANLSHVTSFPGTPSRASQHAGFEGLVGGAGIPDGDTGAIVHKTIQVSGTVHTRIAKEDIFDMTYNLYLAGSKANKIMFHPRHAIAFSSFVNDNTDEPLTYRMFDGLNPAFNTQVKKIRDPLSREYTLIPNRFVPEDKIYFFNESDWTQMVLREPKKYNLMKEGSSEKHMIEMEVGLRHKHPYASGVLTLTTVDVKNNFNPSRIVFTASVNDRLAVRSEVTVDGVAERDLVVTWHTSDPAVATYQNATSTTDGQGRASNQIQIGNKLGTAEVWTVCRGVRSTAHLVTVLAPTIELMTSEENPNTGAANKVTLTATVKKVGGAVAGSDLIIKWFAEPSSNIEFEGVESTTTAGVATVKAQILKKETTLVQGSLHTFDSNGILLNYIPKPARIEDFTITPNTIDINGFSDLSAKVVDGRGNPMAGIQVNWISNDPYVAKPEQAMTVTEADGVAKAAIKGISKGSNYAQAIVGDIESIPVTYHVGQGASLDFEINPNPTIFGQATRFYGSIKGQDGLGIPDVDFVIKSDVGNPPVRINGSTDSDGDFNETYTFTDNSDHNLTMEIPSLGLYKTEKLVIEDPLGIGELRAAEVTPQPIPVGGKSSAKVVLTEGSGMPLKDAEVKWTVGPAHIVTPNATVTRTDQNGVSIIELTGVGKGTGEVVYQASRKVSDKATFFVGQGTELVLTHSPEKPLSNQEVLIIGQLKNASTNAPVSGAEVVLKCSPDASYFPDMKLTTDSQGFVEYKTIFITEEDFVITANAPAFDITATNTVEVQPIDGTGDIKYVHSVSGHTVRHTHSLPTDLPVTLYTTQHGGLPALNMKMECLDMDPTIAQSIVPNITTNTEGKILFHIRGLQSGIARFRVRAVGAIANFIDFEVTVADPQLGVTISPTTVGGGKKVEFSADLKDTHGNWVPGVNIRWEYPHNMLANGGQLGVQETDQFGRVFYDRVAALWGTHKIRAIMESNPLVRSRDHTLTIHM